MKQLYSFYRKKTISDINWSIKVVENEYNYFTLFQQPFIRNSSDKVCIPVGRLPHDRCYILKSMSRKKKSSFPNLLKCKTECVSCSHFTVVSSVRSVALAAKMLGFENICS